MQSLIDFVEHARSNRNNLKIIFLMKAYAYSHTFTIKAFFLQKNDFAEFLSGAERDNTQHIVIDYYEKEQKRKKSKKNASGTPRTSR